jgi:hypothetical protein
MEDLDLKIVLPSSRLACTASPTSLRFPRCPRGSAHKIGASISESDVFLNSSEGRQ